MRYYDEDDPSGYYREKSARNAQDMNEVVSIVTRLTRWLDRTFERVLRAIARAFQ
jgi:hypothetical protein